MYATLPLVTAPDEVWLLVEYPDTKEVDCFRLGIDTLTDAYAAFPVEDYRTDALLPVCRDHNQPVPCFVWADVDDLERNPAFPGHHDTTR